VTVGGERRPDEDPNQDWRISPISLIFASLVRALAATIDFRYHGDREVRAREREGRPFILAFWHRHLVLMRYAYFGRWITVMVSQSRDGEISARSLARLGVDVARGSTTRGGAMGLRDLLRHAAEGSDLAFTPDGPRGPARKVQPGVVVAAGMTGFPVIPVAVGASRARTLRSWDRMLVPLPFARVDIVYGEALSFDRRADVAAGAARLEAALNAVESRAETLGAGRVP